MQEKERMKRRGKKRKTEGEKERGEVGEDGAEEVVRRARCCARSWSCIFMSAGVLSCPEDHVFLLFSETSGSENFSTPSFAKVLKVQELCPVSHLSLNTTQTVALCIAQL